MRLLRASVMMRISSWMLRFIRSISPSSIDLARRSFSTPLREKIFTSTTVPSMPGRRLERGVADVAGLLAEDGAEQLLFGSELRLALRRDFADEDVALLDGGADADDAATRRDRAAPTSTDVRDVARDLFGTELGVAGFDLELFDVDRGVVVLFDQLLGDEDGVLEVVAAPRHEGDEDVAAESQLAGIGAGTVGEDLALADPLPFADDRLLRDAGVLVGALELDELIDVGAELLRLAGLLIFRFDANDDAVRVDEVDDAAALAEDDGAGVAGHDVLHAGADQRRIGAEQRNGLALHVGAHECAVRVVVLEERNERGGHGDELLRRDVDEVDLLLLDRDEVAGLAGDDAVVNEVAVLVHHHVGLRDRVALFVPRREVERVRLGFGELQLALARLGPAFSLAMRLFSFCRSRFSTIWPSVKLVSPTFTMR